MRISSFLNQSRFPRLWHCFQYFAGCAVDKRRFIASVYRNDPRVLEVGCSTGNMAKAFVGMKGVAYTGLDIDPVVIERARKTYAKYPNFNFVCEDLMEFAKGDRKFELILFPAVFHHVDDPTARKLLQASSKLLAENGRVVVIDQLKPESKDPDFYHLFMRLEQGSYVRFESHLRELLSSVSEFCLNEFTERHMGATPISLPKCVRFAAYTLTPRTPPNE